MVNTALLCQLVINRKRLLFNNSRRFFFIWEGKKENNNNIIGFVSNTHSHNKQHGGFEYNFGAPDLGRRDADPFSEKRPFFYSNEESAAAHKWYL